MKNVTKKALNLGRTSNLYPQCGTGSVLGGWGRGLMQPQPSSFFFFAMLQYLENILTLIDSL